MQEGTSTVVILSTATGRRVVEVSLPPLVDLSLTNVGDIDGDQRDDLGATLLKPLGPESKSIIVGSRNWNPIYGVRGPTSVVAAGDQNGDGTADLLVQTRRSDGTFELSAVAGSDTLLDVTLDVEAWPSHLERPRRLSLRLSGPLTGGLARIFVRSVDGTPLTVPLTPWTPLPADDALSFSSSYPPAIQDLVIGLQGVTVEGSMVRTSAVESVQL